jgi:hypothetical protein
MEMQLRTVLTALIDLFKIITGMLVDWGGSFIATSCWSLQCGLNTFDFKTKICGDHFQSMDIIVLLILEMVV